jgi:hypothetical protein
LQICKTKTIIGFNNPRFLTSQFTNMEDKDLPLTCPVDIKQTANLEDFYGLPAVSLLPKFGFKFDGQRQREILEEGGLSFFVLMRRAMGAMRDLMPQPKPDGTTEPAKAEEVMKALLVAEKMLDLMYKVRFGQYSNLIENPIKDQLEADLVGASGNYSAEQVTDLMYNMYQQVKNGDVGFAVRPKSKPGRGRKKKVSDAEPGEGGEVQT